MGAQLTRTSPSATASLLEQALELLQSRQYTRDFIACDGEGQPVSPLTAWRSKGVRLSISGAVIAATGGGASSWPVLALVKSYIARGMEPRSHERAIQLLQRIIHDQKDPA